MKIFIGGGDGSGKSTLAKKLSTILNIPVYSFGDLVRKEVAKRNKIPYSELKKKPTSEEIRNLLRSVGQNYKYIYGYDIWVKKFKNTHSKNESYIIDDMRFIVELDFANSFDDKYTIYLDSFYNPDIDSFEDLFFLKNNSDYYVKDIKNMENSTDQILLNIVKKFNKKFIVY